MVAVEAWMRGLSGKLSRKFGSRLLFLGLQGSDGRGEANEDSDILFINVPGLFSFGPLWESQNRLIQNLLMISAEKNLQLSRRSLHTSPKTIRGRLFSYFSQQVSAQGSSRITIPFDRQQLADYLNLDRSALSKELGKMKRDGLIAYHRNRFEIKMDVK